MRYYSTPYWPCPIYKCRMRYIYFSSHINLELAEKLLNYKVIATIRPAKWVRKVKWVRKITPIPRDKRSILCVYLDARHLGHVVITGEYLANYMELKKIIEERGMEDFGFSVSELKSLALKTIVGWGSSLTDDTPVKILYFKWIDNAQAVAIGHFKKTNIDEFPVL
jgi:hypothetical protein